MVIHGTDLSWSAHVALRCRGEPPMLLQVAPWGKSTSPAGVVGGGFYLSFRSPAIVA